MELSKCLRSLFGEPLWIHLAVHTPRNIDATIDRNGGGEDEAFHVVFDRKIQELHLLWQRCTKKTTHVHMLLLFSLKQKTAIGSKA